MSAPYRYVLLVYAVLVAIGVLLMLAQRRLRPAAGTSSRQKLPVYVLLNLTFFVAAWLPQTWHGLAILLTIIGASASWEFGAALRLKRNLCLILAAATAGLLLCAEWLNPAHVLDVWLGVFLIGMALASLVGPYDALGRRVGGITASTVYLPVCLATLLAVWHLEDGAFLVVFFYLIIVSNDAYAQITGELIGRHRLAPRLSPTKTLEGALGGILCAALVGAALSVTIDWTTVKGLAVGIAVAVAGLTGDLVESSWKRAIGVKDFSSLLGAQGGVLDRYDAMIFAAPVFYLVATN